MTFRILPHRKGAINRYGTAVATGLAAVLAFVACAADAELESPTMWPTDELAPLPPLTPAPIALANLDAQIDGIAAVYRLQPRNDLARQLFDLYALRFQFLADERDLQSLVGLANERAQAAPNQVEPLLMVADANMAVHRFAKALSILEQGERLALDALDIAGATAIANKKVALRFLVGDEPPAVVASTRAELARQFPSFHNHAEHAVALALDGAFEEADDAYETAAQAYRDVSPFSYAWLSFQRGLMWCEMADECGRAFPHYQRAVTIMPNYVVANVHLAELEMEYGQHGSARARLQSLLVDGIDPEVPALLAEIVDVPDDRDQLIAAARKKYAELLERFPLAYADHAAEFFSGVGNDMPLALQLAQENLDNRQTDRALSLAISVGAVADDISLVCQARAVASARRYLPQNRLFVAQLRDTAALCDASSR